MAETLWPSNYASGTGSAVELAGLLIDPRWITRATARPKCWRRVPCRKSWPQWEAVASSPTPLTPRHTMQHQSETAALPNTANPCRLDVQGTSFDSVCREQGPPAAIDRSTRCGFIPVGGTAAVLDNACVPLALAYPAASCLTFSRP